MEILWQWEAGSDRKDQRSNGFVGQLYQEAVRIHRKKVGSDFEVHREYFSSPLAVPQNKYYGHE